MEERVKALAKFLGCEVEELKEGYRENSFETEDGEEYLVFTEEEADEEFYNYEENVIEEFGLSAFSDWARNYIINNFIDNEYLRNMIYNDYENYCDDIETESASDEEYENRLEEEMAENDCETKEDYIEYLTEFYDGEEVDYFTFNFGDDYFIKMVEQDGNIMDVEKVIEYIKDEDERGFALASYDGVESEQGNFYIYRIN